MATLKACIRNQRSDGFYPVYIRISHHSKTDYIPTEKVVDKKGLTKNKDIKDAYIIRHCADLIVSYTDKLNKVDITKWTAKDIKVFLMSDNEDISFSDYARMHHDRMIDNGQIRNAKNYELAYQHLERFAGTNKVMFSHMTSVFVEQWINSLASTKRAKEMYPVCIRQIFRAAMAEYNDYDNDRIRIKTNPWIKVKIPTADKPQKLAISAEECRAFFYAPLPESKMAAPLPELGRDVAMMVMCLAGINTIDLFEMKKKEYYNGILHYNRKKTMKGRADDAYFEIRVPAILIPIFDKYLDNDPNEERLFTFYKRHSTSDSFGANVNIGIKRMCASMGIDKEHSYCVYTFRHTWGTIAQNDCEASIADVAFAMNHSFGLKVTRGYLKIDFTPAWELNEKVVDFIFFSTASSKQEEGQEDDNSLRISKKYLIHGEMYFRGKLLHSVEDIGYNNKEEVISELAKFVPEDIPERSMIMFRIENKDKGQVGIYERMKGGSIK